MNVRVPKEYSSLSAASQRKILEYHEECYNRDIRIILDLYMKMRCVTLHDNFEGWNEEQLTLLMGHHRALFFDQRKKVAAGEQLEYLNKRMAEIFPKNGFPQGFFDKMLGEVKNLQEDSRDGSW